MNEAIKELKALGAAYQAALEYDFCPDADEAADLVGEIETPFSVEDFRTGANKNGGRSPAQIALTIIDVIGSL